MSVQLVKILKQKIFSTRFKEGKLLAQILLLITKKG